MNVSLSALSLALVSIAVLGGCNDRARGPGVGDDASMGFDTGTPSDGSPGDGSPDDTSTTGDTGMTLDTSTPPGGCNLDVKFEGLPTDPACDDTWTEAGATLAFVNTTADDCTAGRCSYMTDPTSNAVWLYPGRLEARLQSAGCGSTTVEVDIDDFCGAGCTKAFAYDTAGTELARAENTGSGVETLTLTSTTPIATVAVSSCEGMVTEIRFR